MNNESKEKNPNLVEFQRRQDSVFTDWTTYMQEKLIGKLKAMGFTFIPPKPNNYYREQIQLIIDRVSKEDEFILRACLNFLEKGLLIDGFGNNEDARHAALLNNEIEIDGQPTRLYNFSKKVNKLAANPISSVLTAIQILDNQDIKDKARKIAERIKKIKQNPGFFRPEDLTEVDRLAQESIDLILAKNK